MKKEFETPEVEIIEFKTIETAGDDTVSGDDNVHPEGWV